MAKTYATLITEAREILQDTQEPYRYSDELMINLLNRGLQAAARIRPDAFWDTFSVTDIVVPEITTGDLNAVFPIPMQFYNPIVYYLVAWAEVVDDEFTVDSRAATLNAAFKAELLGL